VARKDDPHRLVTVHVGPLWDVELLAMQLEEAGIDAFLPDKMTKTVDPFITGANPLDTRLQVRADDAEQASAIVEEARARLKAAAPDDDEEEPGEAPEDEVEWLASRTRWAALIGFTIPFALLSGWLYLQACREYGRRSRFHGLTLAAFGISVVAVGVPLAWLLLGWVVPTVVG